MIQLQAAEHVRYRSEDHGGVIMLDAGSGEWIALNPTAGDLWRSWDSGTGFDDSVAAVVARFPDTCPKSIRADAERLLDEFVSRGLIDATPVPPAAGVAMAEARRDADDAVAPGLLYVGIAFIAIVLASVLLRCSFRVPFAIVRACHRRLCARVPRLRQASRTVAAVSSAARYYPGRAACLELSLAAVLLAAMFGRKLNWCLGSISDPYQFHAWVESNGRAVPAPSDPEGSPFRRVLSV